MRSRDLILALALATLIAAGCGGRGRPSTDSVRQDESLSGEAAAAFGGLPAVELSESEALRTFRIDPAQSKAAYIVDEEFFAEATRKYGLEVGKYKVAGETQDVVGVMQLGLPGETIGSNRFAVYLPTLQTDQKLRDGWIRENALESGKFPLAIFVAREILNAPEGYTEGAWAGFQLEGELTLRGKTMASVWEVSARLQDGTIDGSLETRMRMTDLSFAPPNFANTLTVQDEFTIRIDFVANED